MQFNLSFLVSFIEKYKARCGVVKNPGFLAAQATCDDILKQICIIGNKYSGQGEVQKPEHNIDYMAALEAHDEYTRLKGDGMGLKLNFREWLQVRLNSVINSQQNCT